MTLAAVLRLNALSCLVFGAVFALRPEAVAAFLAEAPAPALALRLLGIGLIAHAAHLGWAAARERPIRWEIRYLALADALWVVATLGLVAGGLWITTPEGIDAAMATAAMVGLLGFAQIRAWRMAAAPLR